MYGVVYCSMVVRVGVRFLWKLLVLWVMKSVVILCLWVKDSLVFLFSIVNMVVRVLVIMYCWCSIVIDVSVVCIGVLVWGLMVWV